MAWAGEGGRNGWVLGGPVRCAVMPRRRVFAALAVGALIVGGGVVVVVASRGSSDGRTSDTVSTTSTIDPRAEEFPVAHSDVAGATLEYLDGDGAALLVMHEAAVGIAEEFSVERCGPVAEGLDRDAPADRMIDLVAGVADPPLDAAFNGERTALGVALTACLTEDSTVPLQRRVRALRDAAGLVEARLVQLRAAS